MACRRWDPLIFKDANSHHSLEYPGRTKRVTDRAFDRIDRHGDSSLTEQRVQRLRFHQIVEQRRRAMRGHEVDGCGREAGVDERGLHGAHRSPALAIWPGHVPGVAGQAAAVEIGANASAPLLRMRLG